MWLLHTAIGISTDKLYTLKNRSVTIFETMKHETEKRM